MLIGVKLRSLKIEDRLQGPVGPSCHYIARSVISSRSFKLDPSEDGDSSSSLAILEASSKDDNDQFDDALQDFGRESADHSPSSSFHHMPSAKLGVSKSIDQGLPHWGLHPLSAIKAEALLEEIFSQREEVEVSNFVMMRIAFRHKESPDSDGIDTQVTNFDFKSFLDYVQ
ncbi:unnamed protein product [Calypogeia fissa]